jgi:hypothetical protein
LDPDRLSTLAEWQARRRLRIDRLTVFLAEAVVMAHHENDAHGWWSRHVAWAIRRLEALGHTFPEVDSSPLPPRIDTILAKAAA